MAQEPNDTITYTLDTVRVEIARLRAGGIPLGRLPYSAQVIRYGDLPSIGTLTIADAVRELGGVTVASQFGSPIQPDLRFRGFQVGPVVGFPQSISVFVDGVRVNEPDASQVNFDLIPLHAVERIEVIRAPGGPFGRNTLAGAINLVTRGGDADGPLAGTGELSAGSFGTAQAQGWVGGGAESGLTYLASGRYYRTRGWRNLSSAQLRQLFTKLGYHSRGAGVWLSYTFADNHVEGPGSLPRSWLRGELPPELIGTEDPRRLQFTGFEGDFFEPQLHFAVLSAQKEVGTNKALQLNAFFRSNEFSQFNDNITEPNARGETDIRSLGGTAQLVVTRPSGITWTGGIEYVRNNVGILIFEVANPAFPDAGGLTEQVDSGEDNLGVFGHLWWPISPRVSFTGSLRYDYIHLPVNDRLDPENSGVNTFRPITGSVGVDTRISGTTTVFASYGRGFRAPVILEISCADPEDPCPLPFELGADPPLDPVETDTWQAGLRYGSRDGAAMVELVGYWAEVYDDLFNVTVPPSTRGFFKNLDRTRRQGAELSAAAGFHPDVKFRGSLALTRATFQTKATLSSALLGDDDGEEEVQAQNEDETGAVQVQPGDHFAMVPNVSWDLGAEYSPGEWTFALDGSYVGSQFLIGDEDNDEEFGKLDSFFVLDGTIERAFGPLDVFIRGENLLDAEFNTFGIISPNVRGPEEDPQPFLSPALPLRVQGGVRWRF